MKLLPVEERLAILRMVDLERKWYALDDKRGLRRLRPDLHWSSDRHHAYA